MRGALERRAGSNATSTLLAVLFGAVVALSCGRSKPPERIVLIVIDTLRRDHLGVYGGDVATPRLDALARRGQKFEHAVSSFHQTSMSMASLFTGRTPSIESLDPKRTLFWSGSTWCGMARFAAEADEPDAVCIPSSIPTLGERLRDAGYWTIGVASSEFLFRPAGFDAGFDDWVELGREEGDGADTVRIIVPEIGRDGARAPTSRARRWKLVPGATVNRAIAGALARRRSDRFFLYAHYMDVHDYDFRRRPYAASVKAVDRAVGGLLDGLERAGLLVGAVVIVTSDHGENLGEQHGMKGGANHLGNPSFDEVLEVPLIIAPPVRALRGREDVLVRSQDLFDWILEIAGAPLSDRDSVLEQGEVFVGEAHYRTYRKGRWKSAMRRDDGRFHLFDLEADPAETRDVAEQHPDVRRAHLIRVSELVRKLRTHNEAGGLLSPRDEQRLRLLGYLE